jgi:AcrR family transcriptional regulator
VSPAAGVPPESSAPRPVRGTRTRAGNAMGRTRSAVLDAASRSVEKYGSRQTTMADVAMLAGIAKATLYNHFRTKPDLYSAAVESAVQILGQECTHVAADEGLDAALVRAAERLGSHPAVRRIADQEPAVLSKLQTITDSGSWPAARDAVEGVLAAAGLPCGATEVALVLRWLVTHVGAPATREELEPTVKLLVTALQGGSAPAPGAPAGSAGTNT